MKLEGGQRHGGQAARLDIQGQAEGAVRVGRWGPQGAAGAGAPGARLRAAQHPWQACSLLHGAGRHHGQRLEDRAQPHSCTAAEDSAKRCSSPPQGVR